MSLKDKIVDDEKELIGKKIVAINLYDPYPLGYIIVEGGEFICFEETDGIDIPPYSTVERRLIYNNGLRKLFLEHNCITQEDYDKYESFLAEEKKKREDYEKTKDYRLYLQLSDKFRYKKDLKKENIFDGKDYVGKDYLFILDKAISKGFYYFSFNELIYSVKDREKKMPICHTSDLK